MNRLLLFLIACLIISCGVDYKGGYKYNDVVNDSLEIEQEMDSLRINSLIRIGPKVTDSLVIE